MQTDKYKLHQLIHATDLVADRLRLQLAPLGIRPRQARILEALHLMGHASQVELTREFDVSSASMSTMTDRLLVAGLITRETDPVERRSNVLRLTEKGEALRKRVLVAWDEVDKVIVDAIGAEKAHALAELTYELKTALGGRRPGDTHARMTRVASASKSPQQ